VIDASIPNFILTQERSIKSGTMPYLWIQASFTLLYAYKVHLYKACSTFGSVGGAWEGGNERYIWEMLCTVYSPFRDCARFPPIIANCRVLSLDIDRMEFSHKSFNPSRPLRQSVKRNRRVYGGSLIGPYTVSTFQASIAAIEDTYLTSLN
jgi:hypothetical protein